MRKSTQWLRKKARKKGAQDGGSCWGTDAGLPRSCTAVSPLPGEANTILVKGR